MSAYSEYQALQNAIRLTPQEKAAPEDRGGFVNAMARGVDQMQLSLYGFTRALGDVLGIDALTKFSDKGIRQNLIEITSNPAEIKSWDDVDSLSEFGTYVLEAIGEQVPQLAVDVPLLLASGGSAVVGKNLVAKLGPAAYMKFKKAAPALLMGNLYAQSAGEANLELMNAGQYDEGGTALLTGVPKAMLDKFGLDVMTDAAKLAKFGKGASSAAFAATPEKIISKIGESRFVDAARAIGMPVDKVKDLALGAASSLKNGGIGAKALTGAMAGMTTEGLTEATQTALDKMAVAATSDKHDFFSVETLEDMQEAAIRGAIVGGAFSGAGSAIDGYIEQKQKAEQTFDKDLSVISRTVVNPPGVRSFETEDIAAVNSQPMPTVTPPPMETRVSRAPMDAGINDQELVDLLPPAQAISSGIIPQAPEVTPQPANSENLIPEPRAQVAAQMDALLDPQTTTDTVFVAKSQDLGPIQERIADREDVAMIPSETGTTITTNPQVAEQAAAGYSSEATGQAIGYPYSKEQALQHHLETGKDPVSVEVVNPEGVTVFDAVTPDDPTAIAETAEVLQAKTSGQGQVRVVPVQDTLNRRVAALEAEQPAPAPYTRPKGLNDPRIVRETHRGYLQGLADELVIGGDVQYIRDANDRIVKRTGSVNPGWFKNLEASERLTVEKTKAAVGKALEGKRLGVREARMVSRMLDVITGERNSYAQSRRLDLEELRAMRRQRKLADNAAEKFVEEEYLPELDYNERALAELASEAEALGIPQADIDRVIDTADMGFIIETLRLMMQDQRKKSYDFENFRFAVDPRVDDAALGDTENNGAIDAETEGLSGDPTGADQNANGPMAAEVTQKTPGIEELDKPYALRFKTSDLLGKPLEQRITSYGISQGETRLAAEIIKEANLQGDVIMMEASSVWADGLPERAAKIMTEDQGREIARLMSEGVGAVYVPLPRNQHAIIVNKDLVDIDQRTFAIAHEIGHIAVLNNYANAPRAVRVRLEAAFAKERETNPRYQGEHAFDEWMADKIAITYLKKLGVRLDKSELKDLGIVPTHSFFDKAVSALRNVFSRAADKVLTVTDETAFARKRPSTPVFQPKGVEGDARYYTMQFLRRPQTNGNVAAGQQKAKQWIHTGAGNKMLRPFITSDGELRSKGKVGETVANFFYAPFGQESSQAGINQRYFTALEVQKGPWVKELATLETRYSEAEWREAFNILSKEIVPASAGTNNPRVIQAVEDTRALLDKFYNKFLHRASPLIGYQQNYFPRYYDTENIAERRDEFIATLATHGIDSQSGENVADILGRTDGIADFEMAAGPSGRLLQSRVFQDQALIAELVERKFLNSNPVETLRRYILNGVQRGTFEQIVGDYRTAAGTRMFEGLEKTVRHMNGVGTHWQMKMDWITDHIQNNESAVLKVVQSHGFRTIQDAIQAKVATVEYHDLDVDNNGIVTTLSIPSYRVYDPNKRLNQTYRNGLGKAYNVIHNGLRSTPGISQADKSLIDYFFETARLQGSDADALEFMMDQGFLQFEEKTGTVTFTGWAVVDSNATGPIAGLGLVTAGSQGQSVTKTTTLDFSDKQREWVMPHEVMRMKTIVNGYFGKIGLDMNPKLQKAQNIALMLTNWLVLSLSTVSSITELGMFSRVTKDMKGVSMLKDTIKEYMSNRQALTQMYETLGVVERHATLHALSNAYNLQNNSKLAQKGNDLLFKLNLQQSFTNMVRTIAAHYATKFLEHHYHEAMAGNRKSIKYIEEVGLVKQNAQGQFTADLDALGRWIQNGKPIISVDMMGTGYSQTEADMFNVAGAIHRIIDTAVMRPNKAERPVWMNDPRWALFSHLKSYSYSFYYAVMKPLIRATRNDFKTGDYGPMFAHLLGFMIPMFAMAAVSNELREEIQYGMAGEYRPSNNMDFGEYMEHLARNRIGMTGVPDMWLAMLTNKHQATLGVFAMSPALSKADQVLIKDETMTDRLLHLTPFVAQNPGLQWYLTR